MHYTKKLRAALDLRNQDTVSLLLDEDTQKLVNIAATLATSLRLTPLTFDRFLHGNITEDKLIGEMRNRILLSEAGHAPRRDRSTDTHETPWAHRDDGKGTTATHVGAGSKPWVIDDEERLPYGEEPTAKTGNSRDARRKELDAERKRLDDEEHAERRDGMRKEVEREEAAFDPNGKTMQDLRHHADLLVKWLMKFPAPERGPKTQEVVSKLLTAANKMLYDPSKHGGKQASWGVSAKYKPTTGLDATAAKRGRLQDAYTYKMESFLGDPDLEQVVLEGVIINEFKWLANKIASLLGRKPAEEKPKKPSAAEINRGKHPTLDPRALPFDHPEHPRNASWNKHNRTADGPPPRSGGGGGGESSNPIQGIIDTIKAADISTHGQTTMLQNVVKFLTKQVGSKLEDPKGRQRQEIISGYVDQLLARQKGKKEMSMTLDVGKMGKELATDALRIYKDEFAKRGYDVRVAMNSGRVVDLAITKSAGKTKLDVPYGKRSGSADATEAWDDTDRTEDDEEALTKEIEPWEEAPEDMKLVGYLDQKGANDPRNAVATDGKTAKLWSRTHKKWVPLDIDLLKLLAKGHNVKGYKLVKKPSGATTEKHNALKTGEHPRSGDRTEGRPVLGLGRERGGTTMRDVPSILNRK